MNGLRILLMVLFMVISGYTMVTISHHGFNLLPIFYGDILKLGWPGQFNIDFSGFLILSATWLAWRHHFSAAGLLLGTGGLFLGMPFLSAYLLIIMAKDRPDMAELLLGKARVAMIKRG